MPNNPNRMPERRSHGISARQPERMPERLSERMSDRMSDRIPGVPHKAVAEVSKIGNL